MAQAVLNWTPVNDSNSISQDVQYRLKGASTWTTFANVGKAIATATITGLLDNEVYEYRIVNNCTLGGPVGGDLIENIKLTCPTITLTASTVANIMTVDIVSLGADVDNYQVTLYKVSDNSPVDDFEFTSFLPAGQHHTHTFTGLLWNTGYYAQAIIIAGTHFKTNCAQSGTATTIPQPQCAAPTGLTATMS